MLKKDNLKSPLEENPNSYLLQKIKTPLKDFEKKRKEFLKTVCCNRFRKVVFEGANDEKRNMILVAYFLFSDEDCVKLCEIKKNNRGDYNFEKIFDVFETLFNLTNTPKFNLDENNS